MPLTKTEAPGLPSDARRRCINGDKAREPVHTTFPEGIRVAIMQGLARSR